MKRHPFKSLPMPSLPFHRGRGGGTVSIASVGFAPAGDAYSYGA